VARERFLDLRAPTSLDGAADEAAVAVEIWIERSRFRGQALS
jgi:hypothetical protein